MRMRSLIRHPMALADDPMLRLRARGKLRRPWWRRRFASFGEGSILVSPSWVHGEHHISIGSSVIIYPGAWLAAEPATWASPAPSLRIGDRCLLRHDVVVSATAGVVIEDDVGLAGRSVIIDSDHTWLDDSAYVGWNRSTATPIHIGWGSWVGEQAMVLQGTRLGAFCLVAANSVVLGGEFDDYSLIAGSPARVVGSTRDRVSPGLQERLVDRRRSDPWPRPIPSSAGGAS
jgi:acetyltransferase-like isoleucine patch superfamily enzyme